MEPPHERPPLLGGGSGGFGVNLWQFIFGADGKGEVGGGDSGAGKDADGPGGTADKPGEDGEEGKDGGTTVGNDGQNGNGQNGQNGQNGKDGEGGASGGEGGVLVAVAAGESAQVQALGLARDSSTRNWQRAAIGATVGLVALWAFRKRSPMNVIPGATYTKGVFVEFSLFGDPAEELRMAGFDFVIIQTGVQKQSKEDFIWRDSGELNTLIRRLNPPGVRQQATCSTLRRKHGR